MKLTDTLQHFVRRVPNQKHADRQRSSRTVDSFFFLQALSVGWDRKETFSESRSHVTGPG